MKILNQKFDVLHDQNANLRDQRVKLEQVEMNGNIMMPVLRSQIVRENDHLQVNV